MSYLSPPPDLWTELIEGVISFADPLLVDGHATLSHWDPEQLEWRTADDGE